MCTSSTSTQVIRVELVEAVVAIDVESLAIGLLPDPEVQYGYVLSITPAIQVPGRTASSESAQPRDSQCREETGLSC